MSWILGLASMCISVYATLCFHPFENETINETIFPLLVIVYAILLGVSSIYEEKTNKRIEMLEKKLSDKEKDGDQK